MTDGKAAVFVYSTERCEPCRELKAWLGREGISFEEISVSELNAEDIQALRTNILAVSRIRQATVPAVKICIGGAEHWVSNHGESGISEMASEIRRILAI